MTLRSHTPTPEKETQHLQLSEHESTNVNDANPNENVGPTPVDNNNSTSTNNDTGQNMGTVLSNAEHEQRDTIDLIEINNTSSNKDNSRDHEYSLSTPTTMNITNTKESNRASYPVAV